MKHNQPGPSLTTYLVTMTLGAALLALAQGNLETVRTALPTMTPAERAVIMAQAKGKL